MSDRETIKEEVSDCEKTKNVAFNLWVAHLLHVKWYDNLKKPVSTRDL